MQACLSASVGSVLIAGALESMAALAPMTTTAWEGAAVQDGCMLGVTDILVPSLRSAKTGADTLVVFIPT